MAETWLRVAGKARTELPGMLERIPGSAVVHADETGWLADGHNGWVCVVTFSAPDQQYFLRPGRGKGVVDPVTDF